MYNYNKDKYYEKKTLVTINSSDRNIKNKLITTINPNRVENNGFKIIDYETILITHNHNYDINNSTEIIFKNIEGTYSHILNKYTLAGIPIDYINYNENNEGPIFNVNFIFTYINGIKISNSYTIKIPIQINSSLIELNTIGGGNNIIVEKIDNFVKGYEDSSFYNIVLPKKFNNIVNVKLVNLEMENAQYSVRDSVDKKYNNSNDYITDNNYFHWINKDSITKVNNNFLITDSKKNTLLNNNNNIPKDWIKNQNTHDILYEHLSTTYLDKINNNIKNLQYEFINLLYVFKYSLNNKSYKNNYFFKFTYETKSIEFYLIDRPSTIISNNIYIDDFKDTNKLLDFIYKFTNYNSTTNIYNHNLSLHFDESDSNSIYYNLKNDLNITINNKNYSYYYIKYLFFKIINDILHEVLQYNYSNIKQYSKFTIYKNEFINYLTEILSNIKNNLSILHSSIIENGYILQYIDDKTYNLYIHNKPSDTTDTINYNIEDIQNDNKLIEIINDYFTINSTLDIFSKSYTSNIEGFNLTNNTYNIPNTMINLDSLSSSNKIIYRNITYVFTGDISNKFITTDSNLKENYITSFSIVTNDTHITINISNQENINKLFIISDSAVILELNIQDTNTHITNFSIYGYLLKLHNENPISFIYNNSVTDYTFLNNSMKKILRKLKTEINSTQINYFNLLQTNEPNLKNQSYWKIPTKINTNIYTENIIKNNKYNTFVESIENQDTSLNLKYITQTNDVYNIYPINSIQMNKGNYMVDEFIEVLTTKLNTTSKKIFDYNSKTFIDDTSYDLVSSLKKNKNHSEFHIELNENNNLVKIFQYENIYSYSSVDLTETRQSGPFIVNRGYPYLFIKHKNHVLKTGDIVNINGCSNIFNISSNEINKLHNIYTYKTYRCYIKFIIPLKDTDIQNVGIGSIYYYEGNKFIDYTSYKNSVNYIDSVNNQSKNNIGSYKNIEMNNDISLYELIVKKNNLITEYIGENITTLGRVIKITSNSASNNFILDYSLLSETNFKIGDIIKTNTTNSYAIIVSKDWTYDYLPKYDNINDTIEEILYIKEGYSIKLNNIPNQTSLIGVGGININILKATEFKILFDKENTIQQLIGFQKKITDFDYCHSNTYKIKENIINYSYLENSYDTSIGDRYVLLKTLIPHNYNVGSTIYINNHLLNSLFINNIDSFKLNIKQYEPFLSYFNNLSLKSQNNIKNSLSNKDFLHYCEKGIIIYYSNPYNKQQLQDLGNIGMCVKKYKELDYFNYKETPIPNIYNLKPNSYIYITKNQKIILKNVNNIKTNYKIGFRDGYYKVLNNIPIYKSSYYSNYFNNTNCAIIECDYIDITTSTTNDIKYIESIKSNVGGSASESILEGYLNNGEIISNTQDTQVIGNLESNYNKYSTNYLNNINNKQINLFFPLECTTYFYINYLNNKFYINNSETYKINIYKNINYVFDISNTNLLNKLLFIIDNENNYIPIHNSNININGIIGTSGSFINILVSTNISNLYIVYDSNIIFELTILDNIVKNYKVNLITDITSQTNKMYEFIYNNNIYFNPILYIELGTKYILEFSNYNDYDNFIINYQGIFNKKSNTDYIVYNNINLTITIFLINNNYDKELYYSINLNNNYQGKFIFGIYNYYNSNRNIIFNSSYIDNEKNILLNNDNIENIDSNIIDFVEYKNTNYYFTVYLLHNLNIINNFSSIIPQQNIHFLNNNCRRGQNDLQIKKNYINVIISSINNNSIILKEPNYNLYVDTIIIFNNNIDKNTELQINSSFYIIEINNEYTQIKIGNLTDKSQVNLNDISIFKQDVSFRYYQTYHYIKNQLINKSIKINYLESYENLTNSTYLSEISAINNKVNYINISNNIYYNYVSNSLNVITDLVDLKWKTPTGKIYIELSENNIINYIQFKNVNSITKNNQPYKIYLYYIEDGIIKYIDSIKNVEYTSFLSNTINKKKFLIYIESYTLHNTITDIDGNIKHIYKYSELEIPELKIGYINPIQNDVLDLQPFIKNISIDNIIDKYEIPDNYCDLNTINETQSLLLNQNKYAIIELLFNEEININHFQLIQDINNIDIGSTSNTKIEFDGTISNIQLFASNNIDFSNEIEIFTESFNDIVRIIDTTKNDTTENDISENIIETNITNITKNIKTYNKSVSNQNKFKYYRFKLISNVNYYPYLNQIIDSNEIVKQPLLETILAHNINNEYNYNYNSNIINIDKNVFNFSIMGIVVGNYEEINYGDLYIEDLNYIQNVIDFTDYIEVKLKYNLLNSHKKGENIIISNNTINENNFSTQNLIIYNKWYTRIFYQGYNNINDTSHISKTDYNKILDVSYYLNTDISTIDTTNVINTGITGIGTTDTGFKLTIYNNSKYTFRNNISLYKKTEDELNEINYGKTVNNYNSVTYVTYDFTNDNLNSLHLIDDTYQNYSYILTEAGIGSSLSGLGTYMSIDFKNNINTEGLPIIQEYLQNSITIDNMNGYNIPDICYNNYNDNINKTTTNETIRPVINNKYNTFTYTYLDLVFKSDYETIIGDVLNKPYKNGIPIYGNFINNVWNDEKINEMYYVNYYSITIEGKYLGYGGQLNNKMSKNDNLLNKNTSGFKVMDIGYDSNNIKNIIKLDLKLSQLGIIKPKIYINDLNLIENKTEKNKYILGYGGNIYQQNIFNSIKNISGSKYLYLSIKNLDNILTTNQINYFSKIILNSNPGGHLYDTYVDNEANFQDKPLDELSELEIKFINNEGKLFNFENSEHSFVLEITELLNKYDNSNYYS